MIGQDGLWTKTFRYLTCLVLVIWLVLPLIPLAIWSFARGWFFPDILPRVWTLDAWDYAMSDTSGVLDSLWLTIGISLAATALSILIGVPAGRALGMHKFRGKEVVEMMILAPMIVPGIAVALGIHSVFIWLGLTNTVQGVILVHLIPTLPYMTLVMAGIFSNYDPAFEAQARSLGASPLKTFWYVTLPAILPGIIVGGLFAFLVSWSQYILTLLIGGGRVVTLPLLLFNFATSGRNDITGAIGMIYILPGILILLLTAKQLSGRSAAVGGFGRL
ncbi:ABC transporter permease subunit [Roseobacter sp. HKCCD9010]|uniref:ABC transporter permease n=1 Tax=unclassified Roseobacter TaxID=196798 RepID=UPI00149247A3|nr:MULTISPECIES: ABC transporter permease [unclassified Roseobacter]MBF9050815.1 ABC transporter permease subunit [Rhodobacterales bacterium HKCCD4356]NNV11767.1 ABC transporter permease subunit [Roseobacter sp. HKCCD7357]NNV17918.1 ABC transporter permease subunit [Roseobacter sp. HKCCD8768]NNV26009.1 ABC transporter permease subunit [Roseobacter sp. HKCCD8192]NNV31645.1 ABC transporter permease subunit [Roseobacter sp. HKCCD9061]